MILLEISAVILGLISFGMAFNTGLSPKESDQMLFLSLIPSSLSGLCIYLDYVIGA